MNRPLKIKETSKSTLWYKKDDKFWVPKANFFLRIDSPLLALTPKHAVSSRLIPELIYDALTEYSYDASVAGLTYSLRASKSGIAISLGGYNDKLPVLLKVVLQKLVNLIVAEDRFQVVKEQVSRPIDTCTFQAAEFFLDRFAKITKMNSLNNPIYWANSTTGTSSYSESGLPRRNSRS